ncbi:CaiB/BaiF CoA-transferase family protein [Aeromicrobium panaciterrae]|uniref:CaiB/BaiF CoA transferase family protein n=1 Tax=Aeromicrobium panaciterrae TaxID=363861 RepID=UPI0031DA7EC0
MSLDAPAPATRRLPFAGVRILDLSHAGAGPFATMQLADLGAEVIKIERPKYGDGSRFFGKKFAPDGSSDYFLALNRNKSSVVVDFSRPEGSELIRSLIETSDVVVENFRPGVLSRHGLGFDDVTSLNPSLIYCSITAFGPTGPWVDQGGNDITIQGLSGLMAGTGSRDGGPTKIGAPICDLTAGLYAAFAIASALSARTSLDGPQLIEVPMIDAAISLMASFVPSVAAGAGAPQPEGTGHAQIVPYQAFRCSDGKRIIVGAFSNQFWRELCHVLEVPELLERDEYRSNELRIEHRDELVPVLEGVFATRDREDWLERLGQTTVPCSPVLDIAEAIRSDQALHNGTVHEIGTGDRVVSVTRQPVRNNRWPLREDSAPPQLGEHTKDVLSEELKLSDADILGLVTSGVVECRDVN